MDITVHGIQRKVMTFKASVFGMSKSFVNFVSGRLSNEVLLNGFHKQTKPLVSPKKKSVKIVFTFCKTFSIAPVFKALIPLKNVRKIFV